MCLIVHLNVENVTFFCFCLKPNSFYVWSYNRFNHLFVCWLILKLVCAGCRLQGHLWWVYSTPACLESASLFLSWHWEILISRSWLWCKASCGLVSSNQNWVGRWGPLIQAFKMGFTHNVPPLRRGCCSKDRKVGSSRFNPLKVLFKNFK